MSLISKSLLKKTKKSSKDDDAEPRDAEKSSSKKLKKPSTAETVADIYGNNSDSDRPTKPSATLYDEVPKRAGDDTVLALDIGTEFVKAVIARRKKNGDLEIIGVGRAQQGASNMYAGAIADIPGVVATCEKALSEAERTAGVIARLTVVGIAGELVKGNTSTVRYKRKNGSKPISEGEMTAIIEKVQARAGEKARAEVALETNNPDIEVRLINSAIVALSIDGYKVSNPIGFKGSDLSIQFYTAYAPLVHISAIEKVCAELNLDLLAVAVEPFAVCRACLGDDLDSNFSAIMMDVGGGTTDLAVINDGGVEGTKMFSIGGRSFTHRIANKLGVDFATAEKLKLNHDEIDLSSNTKAKLEGAIAENLAVWISGVTISLDEFDVSERLPARIYLCGGGAGLVELQEYLATEDWYTDLPFVRRPVVHLVEAEDIPGVVNKTDAELDYSYATALGLLRVALDTMTGVPEGTGLRARIAKLLQN